MFCEGANNNVAYSFSFSWLYIWRCITFPLRGRFLSSSYLVGASSDNAALFCTVQSFIIQVIRGIEFSKIATRAPCQDLLARTAK